MWCFAWWKTSNEPQNIEYRTRNRRRDFRTSKFNIPCSIFCGSLLGVEHAFGNELRIHFRCERQRQGRKAVADGVHLNIFKMCAESFTRETRRFRLFGFCASVRRRQSGAAASGIGGAPGGLLAFRKRFRRVGLQFEESHFTSFAKHCFGGG